MTCISTQRVFRLIRNALDELEGCDDPSFTTPQVDFMEKRLAEIRFALEESPCDAASHSLDVDDMLAKDGKIAIVWCIDDVFEMRPDLSPEQAWNVLETARQQHNADLGISWNTLSTIAEELVCQAPDVTNDGGEQ